MKANAVRYYFTNTNVLHNLVQYIAQDDLKIYQYTPQFPRVLYHTYKQSLCFN